MGTLGTLALIGRLSLRVMWRRLRRGPRHPSWSLPYEVAVEVCRRAIEVGPGGPDAEPPTMPIPPLLRPRVRLAHTRLADLACERLEPSVKAPALTVLYLHGGGYTRCSPATHRALTARLASALRAPVWVPDYRKAPAHPFPAAIDDAVAAYRALLEGGVAPAELVVGGDSAGGGLTLALLQRLRDGGDPLPRAALLLSPWVDLELTGASIVEYAAYDYLDGDASPEIVEMYLQGHSRRDPLASPVHADLSGLPPMLVLTGGLELLVSESHVLVERARAQGAEVQHHVEPDQVHVYPLLADVSAPARDAYRRMAEFVRAHADEATATSAARPLASGS